MIRNYGKFFVAVWCVAALGVLGTTGVAIWAVIKLVNHFVN
jgi:hypothetical protein